MSNMNTEHNDAMSEQEMTKEKLDEWTERIATPPHYTEALWKTERISFLTVEQQRQLIALARQGLELKQQLAASEAKCERMRAKGCATTGMYSTNPDDKRECHCPVCTIANEPRTRSGD